MDKHTARMIVLVALIPTMLSSHRIEIRRNGEPAGVIKRDGNYYNVYGPSGERKGWGRERDGKIEIFDTKGRRTIEIHKGDDSKSRR
jgi:hypothetical protein